MQVSDKIIQFLSALSFPVQLPEGIKVMHPFRDDTAMSLCKQFYKKYYSDTHERWMIIGINPGRFGGGVTGIPFTDPIRLQNDCGIVNSLQKKQELSSVYIYEMIHAYGGPEAFYRQFYITAVSPLGFTRNNKNLNYYDDKALQESVRGFVIDCMNRQLEFGINPNVAFCLGDGKNYKFLLSLNRELNFFKTIVPLAHPRFIMQYRLKRKEEYIQLYISQLKTYSQFR